MTIYEPSAFKVALGTGVAGALVVLDGATTGTPLLWDEGGFTRDTGSKSAFNAGTTPGVFTFVLKNEVGTYTPQNAASTLSTPLFEGMRAVWQFDGSIREGVITGLDPVFPQDIAESARVVVTVSDLLIGPARTDMTALPELVVDSAGKRWLWMFNDENQYFVERDNAAPPMKTQDIGFFNPGASGIPGFDSAQLSILTPSDGTQRNMGVSRLTEYPQTYAAGEAGWWNFWITLGSNAWDHPSAFFLNGLFGTKLSMSMFVFATATGVSLQIAATSGASTTNSTKNTGLQPGNPVFIQFHVTYAAANITITFYANGVSLGTVVRAASGTVLASEMVASSITISSIDDVLTIPTVGETLLSHFSHTTSQVAYFNPDGQDAKSLLELILTCGGWSYDTIPTEYSQVYVGMPNTAGKKYLSVIDSLIGSADGCIYVQTTGTISVPVSKLKVRWRDRPLTGITFNTDDILNQPKFSRDIKDFVSKINASGYNQSFQVVESSYRTNVGDASGSDSTELAYGRDVIHHAEDQLVRGVPFGVGVVEFTVDAHSTTTANRIADCYNALQGDRITVGNLPVAQLGVASIQVWVLGVHEDHDGTRNLFRFYVVPIVTADWSVYDGTAKWGTGGYLSLSAGISSGALAMSIQTSDPAVKFTTDAGELPTTVVVGSENIVITACTSATPQVATITRAANGTVAAAHLANDLLEVLLRKKYTL